MKIHFDFSADAEVDVITDDNDNVTGFVLTPAFRKATGSAVVITGSCRTEKGVQVDSFELSVSGTSGALTKRAPTGKVVPAIDVGAAVDSTQSEDE